MVVTKFIFLFYSVIGLVFGLLLVLFKVNEILFFDGFSVVFRSSYHWHITCRSLQKAGLSEHYLSSYY